ncbi:DUF3857 domain-containing protein [Myxococcota bacterium]|nr:DUF3857 domain-containing protein [Myxococcota bacterium]MBU1380785.1 DUF3857 domain-containing protein [Myxococcota bacterium]MBU1498919.1 DUF3857 domain-containing protein [Myxococcota bacterium]
MFLPALIILLSAPGTDDSTILERNWSFTLDSGLISIKYSSSETLNTPLARDMFSDLRIPWDKSCQKLSTSAYTLTGNKKLSTPSQGINEVVPFGFEKIPGGTTKRETVVSAAGATDQSKVFYEYTINPKGKCPGVFEYTIPLVEGRPVEKLIVRIDTALNWKVLWKPAGCKVSREGRYNVITCLKIKGAGYRNIAGRRSSSSRVLSRLPRVMISAWDEKSLKQHLSNLDTQALLNLKNLIPSALKEITDGEFTLWGKIEKLTQWLGRNIKKLPEGTVSSLKDTIKYRAADGTFRAVLAAALINNFISKAKGVHLVHVSDLSTEMKDFVTLSHYDNKFVVFKITGKTYIYNPITGELKSNFKMLGGKPFIAADSVVPRRVQDGEKRTLRLRGILKQDTISFEGQLYTEKPVLKICADNLKSLGLKITSCNFDEKTLDYTVIRFSGDLILSHGYTVIPLLGRFAPDTKPRVSRQYNLALPLKKRFVSVDLVLDTGGRNLFSMNFPAGVFKPINGKLNGAIIDFFTNYTYSYGNGIIKIKTEHSTEAVDILPLYYGLKTKINITGLYRDTLNFGDTGIVFHEKTSDSGQ